LISINIVKYLEANPKYKLDKIRFTGTRLDRIRSKKKWLKRVALININKFTDCHSYQADVFENWNLMQTLFLKLFDKKIKIIFDKYYSEYTQIRRELKKDKNNL
jgi:hypothetical protein